MHRLLVFAVAGFAALVVSSSAVAWSWPADGDVLRPFALGGDAYAAGQHRGVDVAGSEGSSVRAPAAGTVTFAGSLPTYGRGVTILTADGYAVTLVHLGSIGVAKGDAVVEGASIGTMGWSGDAEHAVPYVHLGIRVGAQAEGYVDPLGLLPPRAAPPAPPPPATSPAPAAASTAVPAPAPSVTPAPPTTAAAAQPTAPAPTAPQAVAAPASGSSDVDRGSAAGERCHGRSARGVGGDTGRVRRGRDCGWHHARTDGDRGEPLTGRDTRPLPGRSAAGHALGGATDRGASRRRRPTRRRRDNADARGRAARRRRGDGGGATCVDGWSDGPRGTSRTPAPRPRNAGRRRGTAKRPSRTGSGRASGRGARRNAGRQPGAVRPTRVEDARADDRRGDPAGTRRHRAGGARCGRSARAARGGGRDEGRP